MALLDGHLIKQKHSYQWLLLFGLIEFVIYMGIRWFLRAEFLAIEENGWGLDFYLVQVVLHAVITALMISIYHHWKNYKDVGLIAFAMFIMLGGTLLVYHFLLSILMMGFFAYIGIGEEDFITQLIYIQEHLFVDVAVAILDLIVIIFWVYIGDEVETKENTL